MESPLNKADISQLTSALYKLRVNNDRIDKLESAGIDVSAFRESNNFGIRRIEAILQAYGPAKG